MKYIYHGEKLTQKLKMKKAVDRENEILQKLNYKSHEYGIGETRRNTE